MIRSRAGAAALVAAVLLVVGVVAGFDWLVVAVVAVVVMTAILCSLRFLMEGQREWFGREQSRRERHDRGR